MRLRRAGKVSWSSARTPVWGETWRAHSLRRVEGTLTQGQPWVQRQRWKEHSGEQTYGEKVAWRDGHGPSLYGQEFALYPFNDGGAVVASMRESWDVPHEFLTSSSHWPLIHFITNVCLVSPVVSSWRSRRTCTHLSPAETPKLQLAAEQPSSGECWNPPKKDPWQKTQRSRAMEKLQQDDRRGAIMFKIKPHTCQTQLEGSDRTLCIPGPRERSRDPTRDWARPAFECLRV